MRAPGGRASKITFDVIDRLDSTVALILRKDGCVEVFVAVSSRFKADSNAYTVTSERYALLHSLTYETSQAVDLCWCGIAVSLHGVGLSSAIGTLKHVPLENGTALHLPAPLSSNTRNLSNMNILLCSVKTRVLPHNTCCQLLGRYSPDA